MVAGRRPKSAELRLLEGNPGKRRLPQPKARPAAARRRRPRMASPPAWMPELGRAEWFRVGRLLTASGILTDTDLTALAAYCDAYCRWLDAREALARDGLTTETASGNLKAHPATVVVHQAVTEMRQFMAEFGLTPAARARVTAPVPPARSIADLLNDLSDERNEAC